MHKHRYLTISIIALLLAALIGQVYAATAPLLGMVDSFAVLSAQSVSSTGATIINGDLGISPGNVSSVTILPPGYFTGELHAANAVSLSAQTDATTAYNDIASQPCDVDLTGSDLGTVGPLQPGVYCFDSSAGLTGNLTLDAVGDPLAVWIFQIGSALTTAPGATVTYVNSEIPLCNVFWQVGSSATLDTTTQFIGNIFAVSDITMNTGANLQGRVIARTGSVTLDDNEIGSPTCIGESVPLPAAPTARPRPRGTATPGPELPGLPAFPGTGSGAPIFSEVFPWSLLIIAGILATALLVGGRSLRRNNRSK